MLKILLLVLLLSNIVSLLHNRVQFNLPKLHNSLNSVDPLTVQSEWNPYMTDMLIVFQNSVKNQTFKSLSFSNNKLFDINRNDLALKDVNGKVVLIKQENNIQLNYKFKTNAQVKNYKVDDNKISFELERLLKENEFQSIKLRTLDFKFEIIKKSSGTVKQSVKYIPITVTPSSISHDRIRSNYINITEPFLKLLNITTTVDKNLNVRPKLGMTNKLRQIEKFTEILDNLVHQSNISHQNMTIMDMGCGLAYLTFAIHSHFIKKFPNLQTFGIEQRHSLVQQTNSICELLDERFQSLHFIQSAVSEFNQNKMLIRSPLTPRLPRQIPSLSPSVDILMALHACDTATDDAIFYGIQHQAKLMVMAPCCHKELRNEIDQRYSSPSSKGSVGEDRLEDVLRYGIYREWYNEMITDTIRAQLLEYCGYEVKLFEFVSREHTAKNVMITAILRDRKSPYTIESITGLMKQNGIQHHHLLDLIINRQKNSV